MNSRYKFRAYDKKQGKMYVLDRLGFLQESDDLTLVFEDRGLLYVDDYFRNTDQTNFELMQWTGLHDKNGVEIYEGDIVNCSSGCPHIIEWTEVPTGAILGGGMPGYYFTGLNEGYAFLGSEEVIGNIFENGDLLNGK